MCVVFEVNLSLQKFLWSFYFSSNTIKVNINFDVPNIPLQTFPENLNTLPLYLKASTIHNNTQVLVNFMSMLCQFLQYISIYNVFLSLCFYLVTNVHNSICLFFVIIIVTFSFFFQFSCIMCKHFLYFLHEYYLVPNAPMLIQTTQILIQNSCYWLKKNVYLITGVFFVCASQRKKFTILTKVLKEYLNTQNQYQNLKN